MLRIAGAVLAGYLTMFALVFLSLTGAYLGMGTDRAFKPDSYDVTALWIVTSTVLSVMAALAGGWVAARISPDRRTPVALALFVFLLGIALAVPAINAPVDPSTMVRDGSVANLDAMMRAKSPTWIMLLNPIIGALGALFGAGLVRRA